MIDTVQARHKIAVKTEEAAILLSIPVGTFRDLLSKGDGPIPVRPRAKSLTFRVSELERWALAQEERWQRLLSRDDRRGNEHKPSV